MLVPLEGLMSGDTRYHFYVHIHCSLYGEAGEYLVIVLDIF